MFVPEASPMLSFKIIWSTPKGKFGWTTLEECVDITEAVDFWHDNVLGTDVPADADIDRIVPV